MSLLDKAGLQELWGKIKNLVSSTTYTKTAIDTALNGKKSTQGAVSDPAASGTGVEFISGISQNAQGVISPSKKTVRTMGAASADAAGSTGLVPAPAQGDQGKFLNGAGQWQTPTHQTIKQNGVTGATANRYGTCTTDAGTAAKTVTITTGTFTLEAGATVYVKFTNSNTANLPTLNVNGTGAKSIMRYGTTHAGTVESTSWVAGAVVPFTYDGTYWIMQSAWDNNNTYSNEILGQGYGTCTTEASTAAKVVALSHYALIKGGVVSVKFTNSVPASATMSINSHSAKAIFYKGAAITAGVIKAGDLATFIYDGTQYNLLSIDRWADDLSDQSQQIGEKADIPVIVSVTVDTNGASMSAADQAKLTADMVMCWYTGNRSKLTSNLSITPGAGSATITGTAISSTTFTIAFIHSANGGGIASVITADNPVILGILKFKEKHITGIEKTFTIYKEESELRFLTLGVTNISSVTAMFVIEFNARTKSIVCVKESANNAAWIDFTNYDYSYIEF